MTQAAGNENKEADPNYSGRRPAGPRPFVITSAASRRFNGAEDATEAVARRRAKHQALGLMVVSSIVAILLIAGVWLLLRPNL